MDTITASGALSEPEDGPRAYFDRLLAEMDTHSVQAFADLAFAQLVLESLPQDHPRRVGATVRPPGAASAAVLRIALSCARSAGVAPDSSTVTRAEADRRLMEGDFILWPPAERA